MLAGVKLSFSLGATKYAVTSLHPALLYKSGLGSDGEIHMISLTAASQGKALLFKASNVGLRLSTEANIYRYHLMASEDLRAWLGITIIPGNRQRNCTFISQCSGQKQLSKATRSRWMQAAGNPWGSFILTPHRYRCLQLLRAQSDTHGLHSSRTGQWDDPEDSPHEARPTSSLSKANMGIRFKTSLLNEGQFFLAPLLRLYSLWPWIWR